MTLLTKLKELNYKIKMTLISSLFLVIPLTILAYQMSPEKNDYLVSYLICITAIILGWVFAFITSPYDNSDKKNFKEFSKLVGTFLTGYFLSKFDKFLDSIATVHAELTILIGVRILLFISFFFLTWIVVYVFRQYADKTDRTPLSASYKKRLLIPMLNRRAADR